jgi:UDP-N-acetyl-D-galactosamine dehydrogenase
MKIAIVGLGYVGLPLAVALSKHFTTIGFDIDSLRIQELKEGLDRTGELTEKDLRSSDLETTDSLENLKNQDVYIITVPTPIDLHNMPDLRLLEEASRMIGSILSKEAIVVFESTVYPGVTETICGAEIEKSSGLKSGKDFFLGYSPERINPGDKNHTIHKITKIVAGQNPRITKKLSHIYGKITQVFEAKSIKTAEAAKVIENAQRDINIAFVNEITAIFNKEDISIYDVLEAAGTKWNFLPFSPGLVGGHCIGVDPYYLADYSKKMGHHPEVILAGRKINEAMGGFFVKLAHNALQQLPPSKNQRKILVCGLTFKENIPDLRNTKAVDIIKGLQSHGYEVDVLDPQANPVEALSFYNILLKSQSEIESYDCIIGAVPHKEFLCFTEKDFRVLGSPHCVIMDIKNMWQGIKFPENFKKVSI